jgi:ferredoxin
LIKHKKLIKKQYKKIIKLERIHSRMVKIDKEKCIGCGLCASVCPDGFEMKDGKAEVKKAEACSKDAAEACPVEAINL